MALVSSGQITIVDNNDARPITAFITASNGTQQVFTKDESTQDYSPDWSSAANTLTAKVYVGGTTSASEVASQLTNRKWSNDLNTSIGAAVTLSVTQNLNPDTPQKVYYFEGDYTDPVTGLVSHVIAQITLGVVRTGTNAVYLLARGSSAILESNNATKNVAVIAVDLQRASGVDTSGITYQFFEGNGAVQITNAMTTKYGLKTTTPTSAPSATVANIGQNLPAAGAWSTHNTLIIHESAVTDMGVFRAVAKDADGKTFQCYFTVYDASDPYDLKIVSTAGDKLQNGVGSTNLYPLVYNGSQQLSVSDMSAWTFEWIFFDGAAPGNRAGFIDTTRTAAADGRNITANTAGPGSVISYSGAAIPFAAGNMVKIVDATGLARYYEVASGSTTTNLTLRTATVSTFLNAPWPAASITAGSLVGGKLFVCAGTGASAGKRTTTGGGSANAITVTGYEIDGKGTIICEANRP